jgi:peptidoglycan/xylan/chitin deacetylase (PgdA/CDA1 family)
MQTNGKVSAICTTSWDDGHPLDQHLAELLAKYGLTGTFYIPLQNSRPVMTVQAIRKLSQAFEVGAHTVNHAVLTEVPDTTARSEIRESRKKLEDITGVPCDTFCFPKGRFRTSHLEMVRRAGFSCARTAELLSTRLPVNHGGLSLMPTTVQASPHRWTTYAKNCAKRLESRNALNLLLYARSRNWVETARAMLQVVAEQGGVFHLWGHSWEIEEQQQWKQLESVLGEMHGLRAKVPCLPNSKLVHLEGN